MQWLGLIDLDTYAANLEREEKEREQRRLARLLHAPEQEKVGGLLFFLDSAASMSAAYNQEIRRAVEEAPLKAQQQAERAQQKAAARAQVETARVQAEEARKQAKAAREKAKLDAKLEAQAALEKAARVAEHKARVAAKQEKLAAEYAKALQMAQENGFPPPRPRLDARDFFAFGPDAQPAKSVVELPVMHLPRDPIARAWRSLSRKKRSGWYDLGERMARFNSRGVELGLTGPEAFRSVNRVREALFAARLLRTKDNEPAVLTDAPVCPTLPPPLSGDFTLRVVREGGCYGPLSAHIVCKNGYACPVRVEFGRPEALEACGSGEFHKLDVVPRLEKGSTCITALLAAQRGVPRVGSKIVAHLTPLSPEGFVNFRVNITATVTETAPVEEQLRAA